MRTILRWALAPMAVLTLAACGAGDEGKTEAGEARPSSETLAATLNGDDDLNTLEGVTTNSGLASVLEGVGPYTVFAPSDAAFGTSGADLTQAAAKAEAAALLRAHIVPGALTRADIAAAIDKAGAGGAKMRTMADGLLTFTRDGEAIVVTGPDGATARLAADEQVASNGVIQPIDGVLLKPASTPGG